MAQPSVAMFTFTLSGNGSIGPSDLHELWTKACGVETVRVTRRSRFNSTGRSIYTLYGPQNLKGVRDIGERVCVLLEARNLRAKLVSLTESSDIF